MVESLIPLNLGDLCEELTSGHQAFHWPWGQGPEGWVVPQDRRRLRLQSLPASALGAATAAAAGSASFVWASWSRRRLQRDLEGTEEGARRVPFPLPGAAARGAEAPPFNFRRPWSLCVAPSRVSGVPRHGQARRRPQTFPSPPSKRLTNAALPASLKPATRGSSVHHRVARPGLEGLRRGPSHPKIATSGPRYYGNNCRHNFVTSDLPPQPGPRVSLLARARPQDP